MSAVPSPGQQSWVRSGSMFDQRGHPHVLPPPKGDRRAEHAQPQEQDGVDLVGPHQRVVEDVAGHDAGKQQ